MRALGAWLKQSGITAGFLFPGLGRWGREIGDSPITDHQLAKIIKRLARALADETQEPSAAGMLDSVHPGIATNELVAVKSTSLVFQPR